MSIITVIKNGGKRTVECGQQTDLLSLLSENGEEIFALCGGNGSCGKCKVRIDKGCGPETVLACRTQADTDMTVYLENAVSDEDISWNDAGAAANEDKFRNDAGLASDGAGSGRTGDEISGTGTGVRVEPALGAAVDLGTTTVALSLFELNGESAAGGSASFRRLASVSRWNAQKNYGADVISRIGYCKDHKEKDYKEKDHKEKDRKDDGDGLGRLSGLIRDQAADMLAEACRKAGVEAARVKKVVLAGNTVMQHIFAGISPESIAAAPFIPEEYFDEDRPYTHIEIQKFRTGPDISGGTSSKAGTDADPAAGVAARSDMGAAACSDMGAAACSDMGAAACSDMGAAACSDACASAGPAAEDSISIPVYMFPCAAGYVGGDIIAGLFALGLAEKDETNLFIDVGTNGEMVLGGKNGMICCATASGPAFEGAGISCGMPASAGAVNKVWLTDEGMEYSVIGGGDAKGICGSGLLDLAACLFELGYVDESGCLEDDEGEPVFYLTDDVYLDQRDIRQLQLAKAAVAAGIRIMLQEAGIGFDQVDHLYLAGGFGNRLDPKSAAVIGMLPRALTDRTVASGNTSLAGAELALSDSSLRSKLNEIKSMCNYIELSSHKDFNDCFVDEMAFPEDLQ